MNEFQYLTKMETGYFTGNDRKSKKKDDMPCPLFNIYISPFLSAL